MKLYTTLARLREAGACDDGYEKLLRSLPKGWRKYTLIDFMRILGSNGIDDALWSLRAVVPEQKAVMDKIARLMAVNFVAHVLPIYEAAVPGDDRPKRAIGAARSLAAGRIDPADLYAARNAARDAAMLPDYDGPAADVAWSSVWAAAKADAALIVVKVATYTVSAAAHAAAQTGDGAIEAEDAECAWQAGVFGRYFK
jgi:hypothetical protein